MYAKTEQTRKSLGLNHEQFERWWELMNTPTEKNPEFHTFLVKVGKSYSMSRDFLADVVADWVRGNTKKYKI